MVSFWLSTCFCRTVYIHIYMNWFNSLGCCWELVTRKSYFQTETTWEQENSDTVGFVWCFWGLWTPFPPETVPASFGEIPQLQRHGEIIYSSNKGTLNVVHLFLWRIEILTGPRSTRYLWCWPFPLPLLKKTKTKTNKNHRNCRMLWNIFTWDSSPAP